MRTVRRAAIFVTAMVFAPAAHAAPPAVSAHASPANGPAPLQVTLTASGDLAAYHWELGDGTTADGPVVQHVYAAGQVHRPRHGDEPDRRDRAGGGGR